MFILMLFTNLIQNVFPNTTRTRNGAPITPNFFVVPLFRRPFSIQMSGGSISRMGRKEKNIYPSAYFRAPSRPSEALQTRVFKSENRKRWVQLGIPPLPKTKNRSKIQFPAFYLGKKGDSSEFSGVFLAPHVIELIQSNRTCSPHALNTLPRLKTRRLNAAETHHVPSIHAQEHHRNTPCSQHSHIGTPQAPQKVSHTLPRIFYRRSTEDPMYFLVYFRDNL